MARKGHKKEENKPEKTEIENSDIIENESDEVDLEIAKEVFAEAPLAEDKKEAVFTEKFEDEEEKESDDERKSAETVVIPTEKNELVDTEVAKKEDIGKQKDDQRKPKIVFRPGIFALGVLSGLIIALAIFGVFYYMTSKEVCGSYNDVISSEKKLTSLIISQKNRETSENGNCVVGLNSAQTQDIKDWQAIENSEFKYSFQIPMDWVKVNNSTDKLMQFETTAEPKAQLSIYNGGGSIERVNANEPLIDSKEFSVGAISKGRTACTETYIVSSTDKAANAGKEKNRLITVQFIKKGILHKFSFTYPTNQDASAEAFDLVLKTVKFN